MSMKPVNLIVLYVDDVQKSAIFYQALLGLQPNVLSEGFIAFHMPGGLMLGLWRKATAKPEAEGGPGVSEIGVMMDAPGGVAAFYRQAEADGYIILQPLATAPFGPTFVIADPDGHRIRVCEPDK
ncbi:VOC family protein [Martelella mediterranea]|uniref:Catechol 2,3-dioxygenase-like lactoylglutathione lyase family enzyme n=1 Tax=Martelella mediterranea TaxID=293089 RepID=A0A4R3NJ32_9HYPH|nr:VOC family protein [Martelella mediterranea]TCT33089.1 catechol 2,3-dioxygenase-like lactoylglutathione lyase family enzyme [Martelella mediterranea]